MQRTVRSLRKNPFPIRGIVLDFCRILADNGAEVVIAGGMGGGAVDIFNERGVEVIVGVEGEARNAVETYLRGELKSTGSICHNHEHAHECGGALKEENSLDE